LTRRTRASITCHMVWCCQIFEGFRSWCNKSLLTMNKGLDKIVCMLIFPIQASSYGLAWNWIFPVDRRVWMTTLADLMKKRRCKENIFDTTVTRNKIVNRVLDFSLDVRSVIVAENIVFHLLWRENGFPSLLNAESKYFFSFCYYLWIFQDRKLCRLYEATYSL